MLRQIVSLLALFLLILCDFGGTVDYKKLHQAINDKSKDDVIRTLNTARSTPSFRKILESKTDQDYTPLISAISNGRLDITKILLNEGANVNAKDKFMLAPLHHAVKCNRRSTSVLILIRTMLSKGANIDAVEHSGMTPLILACKEGKEEFATEFLKKRANVHCEDNSYRTALHYAAENGLESLVDVLVQKKAEVQKCGWEETPQQCALRNGHKDIAFILGVLASKGTNMEVKNEDDDTALIIAVKNGMENCANALLAMGADPNGMDKESCTPIHWAISVGGMSGCLDSLLRYGCDLNVRNIYGKSPLDFAIEETPKKKRNLVINSITLKESLAFTLIEAGVNVPAENLEQLMKYLPKRKSYFNLPFDEVIMELSTGHSERVAALAFTYDLKIECLIKYYEEAKNFALYRMWKFYLLQSGMKYDSNFEPLKLEVYDELVYEISKNTYMEKLPLELVSDVLSCAGEYYMRKLERLAWNVVLASRYLNYGCYCCAKEVKPLAKNLLKKLS